MLGPGPSDKVYPVAKITMVVEALAAEGIAPREALTGVHVSEEKLHSPTTRVSAGQVLRSYRNALRLSRDPQFAYHTGLKFHVSTYGMYGLAILSSTDFRQAAVFAAKYRELATPLADISFKEEDARAVWTIAPRPYPQIDGSLYRCIVQMEMAIALSLHRDVMGPSFRPLELRSTLARPRSAKVEAAIFGCPIIFAQGENTFAFDVKWLDGRPNLGNKATYIELLALCNRLLDEMELRTGLSGLVRETVLANPTRRPAIDFVARRLKTTARSLRRKLRDEGTSFRKVVDELKVQIAIKYIRDTNLSIEHVASVLGFNDASAFRRAFRRWTGAAPHEYRQAGGG